MTTIESQGTLLWTNRLPGGDLELLVPDRSWVPDGEALLRTVVEYVERTGRVLRRGETFAYGYWLVRFEAGHDGRLVVCETKADTSDIEAGADLALRYWREQHEVCDRFGVSFVPPRPDQKVAISAGVFEGDAVQGVRYPAPEHMAGWYITTGRYDGDVSSLKVEHLYHLTAARPDLARFVAVAPGCRFDTTRGDDVWFDAETAAETQ